MIALLCFFLTLFASPFKSKRRLEAENAALRHHLFVLQRRVRGRVQLTSGDRLVPIGPQGHHDYPARDPGALASGRLPSVLALEILLFWRPATDRRKSALADPADERRKSAVGCAAHPWRAAQARLRGRSVQRGEWDGPAVLPPPTTRRVGWGL